MRGNLRYGMSKSMVDQFDKLVALLGIEPLLDRLPGSLSGGEKQRVAIGRALLINLWTDDKDNLWTNIVERQRHALQEIG